MIRWLFILAICGVLAFCGATVPLGKRTFFGHVKNIWASEPMTELKDGVKETAKPAIKNGERFIEGGVNAMKKGSGSGSGSAATTP